MWAPEKRCKTSLRSGGAFVSGVLGKPPPPGSAAAASALPPEHRRWHLRGQARRTQPAPHSTCWRETSLFIGGPAVCPLAGSSLEVSNREMALALEPAQSRRCTEIWLRRACCQIPTSWQSISIINNRRIKWKQQPCFQNELGLSGLLPLKASCFSLKDPGPAYFSAPGRTFAVLSGSVRHVRTIPALLLPLGEKVTRKGQELFLASA